MTPEEAAIDLVVLARLNRGPLPGSAEDGRARDFGPELLHGLALEAVGDLLHHDHG
jgi:hypothetical protein